MNKGKLRSLMFHAGFCNEDGGWDNRPIFEQEHDNFQRFAELIVRECMDLLEDYTTDINVGGIQYNVVGASETLQEHFGIEE